MIEEKYGTHTLVLYDSIDELPIMRYHKFNKYIMIDAGIGENMSDVDKHLTSILQMSERSDKVNLANQVNNLKQALHFAIHEVSPKSMAFAVMVKSIDGKECNDVSEFGLQNLLQKVAGHGISYGMIKTVVETLKKKSRRTLRAISRH